MLEYMPEFQIIMSALTVVHMSNLSDSVHARHHISTSVTKIKLAMRPTHINHSFNGMLVHTFMAVKLHVWSYGNLFVWIVSLWVRSPAISIATRQTRRRCQKQQAVFKRTWSNCLIQIYQWGFDFLEPPLDHGGMFVHKDSTSAGILKTIVTYKGTPSKRTYPQQKCLTCSSLHFNHWTSLLVDGLATCMPYCWHLDVYNEIWAHSTPWTSRHDRFFTTNQPSWFHH